MGVVKFDRNGRSGNIFYVLGMACSTLFTEDRRDDALEMNDRVCSSGSYEEALKIIGEYVELVEVQNG